jgi:hypothetical protein
MTCSADHGRAEILNLLYDLLSPLSQIRSECLICARILYVLARLQRDKWRQKGVGLYAIRAYDVIRTLTGLL